MSEQPHDEVALSASPTAAATTAVRGARTARTDRDALQFVAGTILAGRYRMVAAIGRGGMGEVWRADDLLLGTIVALKFLTVGTPQARERILTEVRLARQITHPGVCRVFDVGEADGRMFCTMELVEGEDLAALLRRSGRLSSEKVLSIARQLCDGLGAAHAQGVLHRDLKPSNILVDRDGAVRIADFGIAVTSDDTPHQQLAGTPRYMAPEVRTVGAFSERSDLYALGLILYELATGRHALADGTAASGRLSPRPSASVADIDPRLDRAIAWALARQPTKRPHSALALSAALDAPTIVRTRAWRRLPMAIAMTAVVITPLLWLSTRPAGAQLSARDTLMVADFDNATGEAVYDRTLKVALVIALEQSPLLRVFPDERARETLRLMQRPPESHVTRAVARDIARREGLKGVVAGSIARLGSHYVLTVEATNAATGDAMARAQAEASGPEAVLTTLGQAISTLRRTLGDSLGSSGQFDVPLPRATTASLDALHAYSLALDDGREIPRPEGIPHLLRAIELDPQFALAHAQLASVYANTGNAAQARPYARRAFELRGRVSERERFFISWRYYMDAVGDWEKAQPLAERWTSTYPREAFAANSVGVVSMVSGRFQAAVDAFRRSIELDRRFSPAYGNLAGALLALNRSSETKAVFTQASAAGVDLANLRRAAFFAGFLDGDADAMAAALDMGDDPRRTLLADVWRASAAAGVGQLRLTQKLLHGGRDSFVDDDVSALVTRATEHAEYASMVGQCAEAQKDIASALRLLRDETVLARAVRALAVCGAADDVAPLMAELTRHAPDSVAVRRIFVPTAAAALALDQGQPARALDALDDIAPYEHAPIARFWPAYLRGQAYLRLHDGARAAAAFRAIFDERGREPASPLVALARLGQARAEALSGDVAAARQDYARFLDIWKDADADLAPLVEARREYARLAAPRE